MKLPYMHHRPSTELSIGDIVAIYHDEGPLCRTSLESGDPGDLDANNLLPKPECWESAIGGFIVDIVHNCYAVSIGGGVIKLVSERYGLKIVPINQLDDIRRQKINESLAIPTGYAEEDAPCMERALRSIHPQSIFFESPKDTSVAAIPQPRASSDRPAELTDEIV